MTTTTRRTKRPTMLPGYVTLDELWPTLNVDEAEVARIRAEMLQRMRAYKLVELRKAYGLTQAQLAERAGIDQPRVSRIERGDLSRIEIATLQALVAALGGELELLIYVGDDIYRLPLGESWHRGRTPAHKTKATGNAMSSGKARSGSGPQKAAPKVRAEAGAPRKTQTRKAAAASAPTRAQASGTKAASSKSASKSASKSV